MKYPRLERLGVTIINHFGTDCVTCTDLDIGLIGTFGEQEKKRFDEYFGTQTGMMIRGNEPALFCSDVEAVLVRMATGRLTGTQHPLLFD